MKQFLKVIFNIFRFFCRFIFFVLLYLIIYLIKFLTYEPGKKNTITPRKARRIRMLSSLKLWFFNTVPEEMLSFLGIKKYKFYINTHLKDGLQLCFK